MRLHRPGTRAHRDAIYKAMCAYQEGASIETAAQRYRVNADTLGNHIKRHGFHKQDHKPSPNTTTIPDAALNLYPRLTPREIADAYGYSKRAIVLRLQRRGSYTPLPVGATEKAKWAASLRHRDQILQAVELRERGLSYAQIGIRLNKPRTTISSWIIQYHNKSFLWQNHEIPDWWIEAA